MSTYESDTTRPSLPEYVCHKVVRASPIISVQILRNTVVVLGGVSIGVPGDFFGRGVPQPGDYLVVYAAEGDKPEYKSWSPKAVFEAGYSLSPRKEKR